MSNVNVITSNKELKFRTQGKMANCESAISVKRDHNVNVKIRDGILIEIKKPNKTIKPKPEKTNKIYN